jgi:predicted membrane-bound dolichyl-phosphate-mannose-protein mannosyltransferase
MYAGIRRRWYKFENLVGTHAASRTKTISEEPSYDSALKAYFVSKNTPGTIGNIMANVVVVVVVVVVVTVVIVTAAIFYDERPKTAATATSRSYTYYPSTTSNNNDHDHLKFRSYTYYPSTTRSCSNNNHDHLKFRHATQASALAEIRRMQRSGGRYTDTDRLNAYYNEDMGSWFVGRSGY